MGEAKRIIINWLSVRNNLTVAVIMLLITGALSASVIVVNQSNRVPQLEKRVEGAEKDIKEVKEDVVKTNDRLTNFVHQSILRDTVFRLQFYHIERSLSEIKEMIQGRP